MNQSQSILIEKRIEKRIHYYKIWLSEAFNEIPESTNIFEENLVSHYNEVMIPHINNIPQCCGGCAHPPPSYVTRKLCELLEYDELLKYFPISKSNQKRKQNDEKWEKICKDLNWDFIPTEE